MENRNILQEIKDFNFKGKYLELEKMGDLNQKRRHRKKLIKEYKRSFLNKDKLGSKQYIKALNETTNNQIPTIEKYRSSIIMNSLTRKELKYLIYKTVQKYLEGITIQNIANETNMDYGTINKVLKTMGRSNTYCRLIHFRMGNARIYYTFKQLKQRFGSKMSNHFNINENGRATRK